MKRKLLFFASVLGVAIFASNANADIASADFVNEHFTNPEQTFAGNAATATNATNDSDGKNISDTYAKKTELNKIPVGGETSTTFATIWVE